MPSPLKVHASESISFYGATRPCLLLYYWVVSSHWLMMPASITHLLGFPTSTFVLSPMLSPLFGWRSYKCLPNYLVSLLSVSPYSSSATMPTRNLTTACWAAAGLITVPTRLTNTTLLASLIYWYLISYLFSPILFVDSWRMGCF